MSNDERKYPLRKVDLLREPMTPEDDEPAIARKSWPPEGARRFPFTRCTVCGEAALPYDDLCKRCWAGVNGQKPPKRLTKFFEDPPPRYDAERGAP